MTGREDSEDARTAAGSPFTTTHWSVVLAAGGTDTTHARDALETLCRNYWYPLYAYVRRRGQSPHDAQDLTQAFFARLLERGMLKGADPARGRFRSFLLSSLKNFLNDEWDKARAQKRGGGQAVLSLDAQTAEDRYQLEPAHEAGAEKLFERRWAMTVIETALKRLEGEYAALGKARLFDALHPLLLGEQRSLTYARLGVPLGMSEGAVKVAAHRLGRRYRELVRAEIAHTISHPAEIEDEIRHLFAVLSA